MSSQRIIQDSDDEDVDARSEVASSCDPLQVTSSYAPGRTDTEMARVDVNQAGDFQIPLSATDLLPQVDFDRFLRSESSIMAGDYEDERWVSTANSGSAHVAHVGNDHTEQLRDDSFLYTINATTTHSPLPQQADVVYGEDFDNHPSKRRRVSPSPEPSHDKELGKSTETNSSYNYFASSGPNDDTSFREVATPLLPLTTDESHVVGGSATTTVVLNSIPVPVGTPPPTIPFSEDAPYEQEQPTTAAPIPQYEIQETDPDPNPDPRQLLSETDTEAALGTSTTTKKKRGRPKKQSADPENKTAPDDTSEEVSEHHHHQATIKKKPGRPKKQEKNDTPSEQLPALDNISNGGVPDASIELSTPLNASVSKPSKKKIKRSKTTSDIPNKKPGELQTESDVIWVESRPVVEIAQENYQPLPHATTEEEKKKKKTTTSTSTDPHDPTKEGQLTDEKTSSKAPKKRGRKRTETLEGPAAPFTGNQAAIILQDISNVPPPPPPPPPQNKEKSIDIDAKSDNPNGGGLDGTNTLQSFSEDASINNANVVGQGAGVETPTTAANTMQPVKQTPMSNTGKVPFRVGLSRRARIAPLLKVVKK